MWSAQDLKAPKTSFKSRAPWKRVFSGLSYLAPYDDRETEKGSLFDRNAAQKHTSKGIVLASPGTALQEMKYDEMSQWCNGDLEKGEENSIRAILNKIIATITFHYRIWERMEKVTSKVHINKNMCLHQACINTTNQKRIKKSKKSFKMEAHKIQVQISFYYRCLHYAC